MSPLIRRQPAFQEEADASRSKSPQLTIRDIRKSGYDVNQVKQLIISNDNINKSLHAIRRNIHFMTKVKCRTDIQKAKLCRVEVKAAA